MTKIENFLSKFRKRIQFNYSKNTVFFDVSQTLFSSADIDKGTFQLIDSLRKNNKIDYESILDLGCGYGAIGIYLKKANANSKVHCIDRDALALEFTKHNAKLNDCKIEVYPSLDYQNVKEKFSLICCNYPAKAGLNALKRFVYDSSNHLKQNGIFAIVIVKELLEDFNNILREEIEVIYKKKSSGHLVFHLRFNKEIGFNGDIYFRNTVKYILESKNYELKTAFNISEFESPSFSTTAIIKIVKDIPKGADVFVIDPYQGHLPVAIFHYAKPKQINLVSRDLLSLEYSKENLKKNGFENIKTFHKINVDVEIGDLLVWRLDDALEVVQFETEFKDLQNNFDNLILAGNKLKLNKIIRLLKLKPLVEKEENSAIAILIKGHK